MRLPRLRTARDSGRVTIRTATRADAAEFVARVLASRELHQPWVSPPASRDQFDAYLRRMDQVSFAGFLACRREDRAIVGYFTLGHIVRDALQSAYLGYAAFLPFAGEGYMTEALHLVLAEVFGPMRLHRVEANIQPANAPSIALARRCGFELEGFSRAYLKIGDQWRDHQRWTMRSEVWAERSGPDPASGASVPGS